MDENLIGYLLDALDSDTRQETEQLLLKNPEARTRLESLRQAMKPLEEDREADRPPPDLWVRTLARVAEYRCRRMATARLSVPPKLTAKVAAGASCASCTCEMAARCTTASGEICAIAWSTASASRMSSSARSISSARA